MDNKEIYNTLTPQQQEQLNYYAQFLVEENAKYNLTAITDAKDIMIKHFIDCLYLNELCDLRGKKMIDFGTGAGFPGMVNLIKDNSIQMTLLESNGKKTYFLSELSKALGLAPTILNIRAEDGAKSDLRGNFDIVTARAVAHMAILLELGMPYLKVGGFFYMMKGEKADIEIQESQEALKKMHGVIRDIKRYDLKDQDNNLMGQRAIICIEKVKETEPKYPRAYAQIKKKPL